MNKLPSFSSLARHYFRNNQADNDVSVPCGECSACCKGMDISLDRNKDDYSLYSNLVPSNVLDHESDWKLPMNEDRLCGYFVDEKCSIYSKRPHSCKTFDCRLYIFTYRVLGHNVWNVTDDSFKNLVERADSNWKASIQSKKEQSDINTYIHYLLDNVLNQKMYYQEAMIRAIYEFVLLERNENKTGRSHKDRVQHNVECEVQPHITDPYKWRVERTDS